MVTTEELLASLAPEQAPALGSIGEALQREAARRRAEAFDAQWGSPPPPTILDRIQSAGFGGAMPQGFLGRLAGDAPGLASAFMGGVVRPTPPAPYNPLAGVTPKPFGQSDEGAVPATPAAPRVADDPLGSLTPEQQAKLAGQTMTIGGGGSRTTSTVTKRTAQLPGYRGELGRIEELARSSVLAKGDAEAEASKQEALAYRGHETALRQRQTAWQAQEAAQQARIAEQEARFSAARAEVAGMKLDPDSWMASRTTGQKIALAMSAAVDGFLAGFNRQGGANPTLELINKYIDRDLETQKAMIAKRGVEASQERGILSDLYSRLGDMRQAEIQARQMVLDGLGTKLKQIAATAQSPIARANAELQASELSKQLLVLKNASYALEQGEKATHETRSYSPGKRVSMLELLRQTQLQGLQYKAATAEARAKEAKANAEIAKSSGGGGGKDVLEGDAVGTMRKVNEARDALNQVRKEAAEIWMGKRELYGKSPMGSTWKSRLDDLASRAGKSIADVTGRSPEQETKALMGRWDNAEDIRQRLLDAHSQLESKVQNSLETASVKYDVKPFVDLELRKRKAIRLLYAPPK